MSALLVFDTSGEQMFVGLHFAGRSWLHEAPGGARASAALVPAAMGLLREAGASLAQLDAIGFGRGPGAFTGLRTACSVAQGLALGADKPVLAIDTLMAVAEDARGTAQEFDAWVAMDARMDQIYAAHYRYTGRTWAVESAPALFSPQSLNERWQTQPAQQLAGNALSVFADRLLPAAAHCHPQALPRAAALLSLAQSLWAQGEALDAAQALPSYVRDKVAQTIDERATQRVGP